MGINRIKELVHAVKKDADVLFNLLVRHQVLEIAVRVVTLF